MSGAKDPTAEKMLPLLVGLPLGKPLADGIKRHLDIDVTEIGQDIANNVHDPVNRDARIIAEAWTRR